METAYPLVGRLDAGHGFCLMAGQLEVVGRGRPLAKVRAAPLSEGPAARRRADKLGHWQIQLRTLGVKY
jgi:hypothetical protein